MLISAGTQSYCPLIRFFRINDPYRLLAAFGLLLLARIIFWLVGVEMDYPQMRWLLTGERLGNGFVMYRDLYDFTGPLSAMAYRTIDWVFGRSPLAYQIIAFLITCFNASILSLQLVRSKAYPENNYLPGLFYVLIVMAIPDGASLSPMLMSSTFILLALNNVFRRVDNEASDELFLFAGIYLGIAVLFYLPAITFFFLLLLSLLIFSTAIPRRLLLYIYGLTIPLILVMANYYWFDSIDYFFEQYVGAAFRLDRRYYVNWSEFWVISTILIFWMIISLYQVVINGRYGNYETKIIQIMLLLAVAAAFSVWLDITLQPAHLQLLAPPLAFFFAHYMLLLRRRIIKSLVPVFLVLTLVFNTLVVHRFIGFQDFYIESKRLPFEDKKTMVLSDQPEKYYLDQQFAGPFMNASLSRDHMRYLDYYETAYQIFESVSNDMPEVIIDELNLVPALFERFPILRNQYRAGSNNTYYLKKATDN